MGYPKTEFDDIRNENFTEYFKYSLGSLPNVINVITKIHFNIDFFKADLTKKIRNIGNKIAIVFIDYKTLIKTMQLAKRQKKLWGIEQLQKIKNNKLT
ncbi:MAG: hypothetical protein KA319_03240 [Ferruginibacter sp.]|nr:hypothetical protein [Ferruginibacter sp.]